MLGLLRGSAVRHARFALLHLLMPHHASLMPQTPQDSHAASRMAVAARLKMSHSKPRYSIAMSVTRAALNGDDESCVSHALHPLRGCACSMQGQCTTMPPMALNSESSKRAAQVVVVHGT